MPTFPTILSATVDDVDNGDEIYGVGDEIILQFDMATNTPSGVSGGANSTDGAKSAVDALFAFSEPLGAQYAGRWVQADRYVVTIIDPTGGTLQLGETEVTVVSEDIRNAAGDALTANNQTVLVHGDFGTLAEPTIERLTVVTEPNATTYSDGDTLVLHMSMLTNFGGSKSRSGDKAYVDHLFGFSHILGADYSGSWEGGETTLCADGGTTTIHECFVISLVDTRGGAAVSGLTFAAPSIHVRSASKASERAANRLSGDRGRRLAPLLVDFFAEDADDSAQGLDPGDTLTLVFDTPTDLAITPPQPWGSGVGEGATSGGKAYVDSLFRFCENACPRDSESHASPVHLGSDYSGAWRDG